MAPMTFTAEFRAGSQVRLTCRLTVGPKDLLSDWWPETPEKADIRSGHREELFDRYREWRNACLERFADNNNLTVEVDRDNLDAFHFTKRLTQ